MKAKFVQRSDSVDFTPERDMAAGEIVRLGNLIGVVKLPIAAGNLGSLSLTGIYDVTKSASESFAAGECVYCDPNGKIGKSGILLGTAVRASNPDSVRILLNCDANAEIESIDTTGSAGWQSL